MSTLVVGGRGAIGAAVVERLRGAGDTVHSLDREDGVDASDPAGIRDFVAALPGPPRRVVHVAGSVGTGGVLETGPDEWHRIMADNLTSAYLICRAVLPAMLDNGGGAIVLTSSVNGRHGGNALSGPAYAAAKAGVIGLGRNIAKEFGSRGVRTNIVAPGPVASGMTERLAPDALTDLVSTVPAGRVGRPEEIAAAVAYLLDDEAGFVNGAVLDINGGMWVG
ncbi:SDR family NAD(P)-dependent oxidoreductase [Mycobacterium sp. NPDC003449]